MSVRSLTAGMVTELGAGQHRPVIFFEMAYNGGTLRLCTHLRDLTWNSQTWTAAGNLLGISPATDTALIEAQGFTATLQGITPAYVSLALSSLRQNRAVKCWLGFLNSSDAVIADPSQFFVGRVDVPTVKPGAETATISVTCENRWIDLLRRRVRRYTDQDQQADFPGDLGFAFVPTLADQQLQWGAGVNVEDRVRRVQIPPSTYEH